jgi:uncharacterized membrane protein YqjE
VAVSNEENKDTGLAWVVTAAAIGLVALGAYYVGLRSTYGVHSLADHANLGNALAPVVAFLTLLAVISALWSVQIQRTELALQRQELRETREEMVEQRKQFERTAAAQEALAASQARLADGQLEANQVNEQLVVAERLVARQQRNGNDIALRAQLALRHATIANLQAAIASVNAAIASTWNPGTGDEIAKKALAPDLVQLQRSLDSELEIAAALVDFIGPLAEEKLQ